MSWNVNRLLITALLAWFALQGMGVFHLYPLVQDFSVHGQYCVNSYRKHSQVPFWNSRAFTNFQWHPLENERRTQEWFCLGNKTSRWWFQIFFVFTPTWGNDPILSNIFQMGWNHQPDITLFLVSISVLGIAPQLASRKPKKHLLMLRFPLGQVWLEFGKCSVGWQRHFVNHYRCLKLTDRPWK